MSYKLSDDGKSYIVDNNYYSNIDANQPFDWKNVEIASQFNGKPVTAIGRWAFLNLKETLNIKIPASISAIDFTYISNCIKLESFEVDENNSVYASAGGILYNKDVTQCIYTPKNITGAVTIPQTMTKINNGMFMGCEKLTGVIMHDAVVVIEKYAFYNCIGLNSITIPKNVTDIESHAFSGCSNLWEIYNFSNLSIEVNDESEKYGGIGQNALNILYGKDDPSGIDRTQEGYVFYTARDSVYLVQYTGDKSELVLPANYKGREYAINKSAFAQCDNLTSIIIPNGITSIGKDAFVSCDNLSSITIPTSVTNVGNNAFAYCNNLISITYKGDKEQWNTIIKGRNWDFNTGEYTIHCENGDIIKNSAE